LKRGPKEEILDLYAQGREGIDMDMNDPDLVRDDLTYVVVDENGQTVYAS